MKHMEQFSAVPTAFAKNRKIAAFAYLVFFAPRFTAAKNDSFVRYHTGQSVGLVIAGLAGQGIISILGFWGAPFGLILLLVWVLRIFLAAEAVMGIRAARAGASRPLPLIGKYAAKLAA